MINKLIKIYFVLALTVFLGGCASNANYEGMTDNRTSHSPANNKNLINNVGVTAVAGGRETNPLWISKVDNTNYQKAIQLSLKNANLYKFQTSRYELFANILNQDQDLFGLNLTTKLDVHYKLKDRIAQKIIYDKVLKSKFTATFSDAAVALVRIRLANEGAAKKNIQMLINDLLAL